MQTFSSIQNFRQGIELYSSMLTGAPIAKNKPFCILLWSESGNLKNIKSTAVFYFDNMFIFKPPKNLKYEIPGL